MVVDSAAAAIIDSDLTFATGFSVLVEEQIETLCANSLHQSATAP